MEFLIVTDKDGKPYPAYYPQVVRPYDEDGAEPGTYVSCDPGNIHHVGKLNPGFSARPPKNANERRIVQAARDAQEAQDRRFSLQRWTNRDGKTVSWGNIIAGMSGQAFSETFATEDQAVERERQAKAGEPIRADREPVAVERIDIGAGSISRLF